MTTNYTHTSGLEFDLGYVDGYDITVILLFTGDDYEHDHVDPYLVGHWYGTAEYMHEDDAKYLVDKWLASKTEAELQRMLGLQQALHAEIASWKK